MSLQINFEPHSWYMGFVIRDCRFEARDSMGKKHWGEWEAYTDNGNTYRVDEITADTLAELKQEIREYRQREKERITETYARLEATK